MVKTKAMITRRDKAKVKKKCLKLEEDKGDRYLTGDPGQVDGGRGVLAGPEPSGQHPGVGECTKGGEEASGDLWM